MVSTRKLRNQSVAIVLMLASGLSLSGCFTTHDADELSWEDLTSVLATEFSPQEFGSSETEEPKQFSSGIDRLRLLTSSLAMEEAVPYHKGMLGKIGSARMFVSTRDKIPNFTQLYWIMVRVLSEKYGCFMTRKVRFPDESVKVDCRDKRQIVLWPSIGSDWIQFYSRQFDGDGYEIKVEKRRVVRIGSQPEIF